MSIRIAIFFILLIECITYIHNHSEGIYLNWLYILYACISILFCRAMQSINCMSLYGYLAFAATYMIFALVDTFVEFNVITNDKLLSDNYTNIMCFLIAFLFFLVTYGRMDRVKHRAYRIMLKPLSNSPIYSEHTV